MAEPTGHVTVLRQEALEWLACRPGGTYVDCTLGGGGHSAAILQTIGPEGHLIGLDQDDRALAAAGERLRTEIADGRATLVRANFADLGLALAGAGVPTVDGVLFDLGVSSFQLDEGERGFSYQADYPLDMRMDRRSAAAGGSAGQTARDLVNGLPERELARVIREYGEERWATRIAAFIVQRRVKTPIETTGELVDVIKAAVPAGARREGPHPAKRTFQALRIAVNDELGVLERGLSAAIGLLKPGGRIVAISFHSLEDRVVKEAFAQAAQGCTCPKNFPVCVCGKHSLVKVLTRKPVAPSAAEIMRNPRARSAKLRASERVQEQ